MSHDQHVLEASTSRCKMQLQVRKTSTSNHMMARKSTANVLKEGVLCWRRKAEIKQLEQRLRALEEEADMLKGDLLESVEESKRLITEIHQYFNTIQDCLLQREVDRGESYSQGIQIISLLKERRAGLLQVLCQESNPSIVNKGLRTTALE